MHAGAGVAAGVVQDSTNASGQAAAAGDHSRHEGGVLLREQVEERFGVARRRLAGGDDPIVACLLAQGFKPPANPPCERLPRHCADRQFGQESMDVIPAFPVRQFVAEDARPVEAVFGSTRSRGQQQDGSAAPAPDDRALDAIGAANSHVGIDCELVFRRRDHLGKHRRRNPLRPSHDAPGEQELHRQPQQQGGAGDEPEEHGGPGPIESLRWGDRRRGGIPDRTRRCRRVRRNGGRSGRDFLL